jgi:hypothetical protein
MMVTKIVVVIKAANAIPVACTITGFNITA